MMEVNPVIAATLIRAAHPREWEKLAALCSDSEAAAEELLAHVKLGDNFAAAPRIAKGEIVAERYELMEFIDHGGQGVVWRARDQRTNRDVALKLYGQGIGPATPAVLTVRALDEARLMSAVLSPNVMRVWDVSDAHERIAYVALELNEEQADGAMQRGVSLNSSEPMANPRSVREAVRWAADTAAGLVEAHLSNIFHRDVKLGNMLLSPLSRRVRLIDFGLAASPLRTGLQTTETQPVGTPHSMAPEMARAEVLNVNGATADEKAALARVDVFGVGAALHHLLTGAPLFESQQTGLRQQKELLAKAVLGERTKVVSRFDVPQVVERIVAKATAHEPEDRYPSMAALAQDLEKFLRNEPTSFERGWIRKIVLFNRRWRWLPFATAIVVLLTATLSLVAKQRGEELATVNSELRQGRLDLKQQSLEFEDTKQELENTKASIATIKSQLNGAESLTFDALAKQSAAQASAKLALAGQKAAEESRDVALANVATANASRDTAETARQQAEQKEKLASEARDFAEAARRRAEDNEKLASEARDAAEAARKKAEESEKGARVALGAAQQAGEAAEAKSTSLKLEAQTLKATVEKLDAELKSLKRPTDAGVFSPPSEGIP